MKRNGCILFLLLAATANVFSQTFQMDVHDEPLNKVLNRLDLEISFNDRALSAYSVSAAREFENQEKALLWLLEGKPFRIEKIGTAYVIVPCDNQLTKDVDVALRKYVKERFTFKGTVVSASTGEPLEFAVVSLLDDDNLLLTNGITTANGLFTIQASYKPTMIKISYLGYETLTKDIHDRREGDLGMFLLAERVIALDETVVTADNLQSSINQATYTVTARMTEGADNALALLNSIPGAYFDEASGSVLLNHQANLLFLVDGIQQSTAYLHHLSPRRVQAIDVVYALSGRFVSDDYAGIVNFLLKKDYSGYDIYISNASSLNLSQMSSSNSRLSKNNPSVGMIFTTRKLNFFGTYDYDMENYHMPSSKSLSYGNYELVSNQDFRPNNSYRYENHAVNGGANYHITPRQLIGIQADFASGVTSTFQEYPMQRTDLTTNSNRYLTNTTENMINASTFTGTLFYRGQASDRLYLYGDFSYNYYYNDMENDYRQDEASGYHYSDVWNEFKHQTVVNVDGKYLLSKSVTIEAGYSHIHRQYASTSSQGRGFLDYNERRNKAFVYFTCYLSDKTGLKFGFAPELIRQQNGETEQTGYIRVLPFLRINRQISAATNISAGYATSQSYPALYQLSPMSIVIDTFLTQTGNPALLSAVRHQVFAELTLWSKLKIMPQFNFIRDGVSETYSPKEFKLYRTFDNVDYRMYNLFTSYDQSLGTRFRLKSAVMLYHREASHEKIRNSLNGWNFHSEVDYYHTGATFGMQLGYYRNMKKDVLWQGYQMSDKDYWCVTVRKELWHNRVSATLSYIPPIAFGVRYDQMKEMHTPHYREKTTLHLESYNRMLLLKVSLRLERGGIKSTELQIDKRKVERER